MVLPGWNCVEQHIPQGLSLMLQKLQPLQPFNGPCCSWYGVCGACARAEKHAPHACALLYNRQLLWLLPRKNPVLWYAVFVTC